MLYLIAFRIQYFLKIDSILELQRNLENPHFVSQVTPSPKNQNNSNQWMFVHCAVAY